MSEHAKVNQSMLFYHNLRYAFENYFLSHALFCFPALLAKLYLPSVYEPVMYICLSCWFAYGLYRTQQRQFVLLIAFLFIGSQLAYFQGAQVIDALLTIFSVAIMCVKQYYGRFTFGTIIVRQIMIKEQKEGAK